MDYQPDAQYKATQDSQTSENLYKCVSQTGISKDRFHITTTTNSLQDQAGHEIASRSITQVGGQRAEQIKFQVDEKTYRFAKAVNSGGDGGISTERDGKLYFLSPSTDAVEYQSAKSKLDSLPNFDEVCKKTP